MILLLSICSVLAALAEGEMLGDTTTEPGQQVPTVTIAQGDVIGSVATDGDYYEFHGIPYAGSTSGKNRFKAPSTPPEFKTPFEANRKNIKCVRPLGQGYEGTEDCLVVNVFTPTLNTTKNLSVMVWIKGKEFDRQNGQDVSFRNFVQKDVVVVSLNYRESILGFLCLGTKVAPGNAGLKDIIAGLKWVKTNIAAFGGNPESITLIGHGSGAAAVDLVTMSPMGENLVQRAIAQSGSALAPWAVTRDNLKYAHIVAEALGHEIQSIEELSDVFNRPSVRVSALMGVINELDLTDNSLAFAPCVERKELEDGEPFLTKTPSEIIRDREFADIPMIFGFVDNEGTIRAKEAQENDWIRRMQEKFEDFIPPDLQFQSDDDEKMVVQQIRQRYFPENKNISETEYLKYHGDTMVLVSALREVRNRVFHSENAQYYLYQFSYSGTLGKPLVPIAGLNNSAAHSEELAYMFYNTPVTDPPDLDHIMGNILIERWTNFAKHGVPKSNTSSVTWLPRTHLSFNFIRQLTSTEINVVTPKDNEATRNYEVSLLDPHLDTINFWDEIYTTHLRDAQSSWLLNIMDDEDTDISAPDPSVSSTTSAPADDDDTINSTPDPSVYSTTSAPADDDDTINSTPDPNVSSTTSAPADDDDTINSTPDPSVSSTTSAPADDDGTIDSTPDPSVSSTTSAPADDGSNSASTAIAYTLLIVSLFSLLSHLHSSLILS